MWMRALQECGSIDGWDGSIANAMREGAEPLPGDSKGGHPLASGDFVIQSRCLQESKTKIGTNMKER